jgi:hypothetical protein
MRFNRNNFNNNIIHNIMNDLTEYQALRIEALEAEILRLNDELMSAKIAIVKIKVSDPIFTRPYDPNFDKKLSEINVNYDR